MLVAPLNVVKNEVAALNQTRHEEIDLVLQWRKRVRAVEMDDRILREELLRLPINWDAVRCEMFVVVIQLARLVLATGDSWVPARVAARHTTR